jgi:hypothetical protein
MGARLQNVSLKFLVVTNVFKSACLSFKLFSLFCSFPSQHVVVFVSQITIETNTRRVDEAPRYDSDEEVENMRYLRLKSNGSSSSCDRRFDLSLRGSTREEAEA